MRSASRSFGSFRGVRLPAIVELGLAEQEAQLKERERAARLWARALTAARGAGSYAALDAARGARGLEDALAAL
jgi:hypothetical protein